MCICIQLLPCQWSRFKLFLNVLLAFFHSIQLLGSMTKMSVSLPVIAVLLAVLLSDQGAEVIRKNDCA